MEGQQERIRHVLSLEKTKSSWRKKHNSEEFKAASNLNHELFGIHLNRSSKCQCIEDLFFMLNRMNEKKLKLINQIKMNQFKLKKGKMIMMHSLSTSLTEKNMTDDLAIEVLKVSKGHIKSFESYPENWESLVNGTAPVAEAINDEDVPVVWSKTMLKKRAKQVGLSADATQEEVLAAEAAFDHE